MIFVWASGSDADDDKAQHIVHRIYGGVNSVSEDGQGIRSETNGEPDDDHGHVHEEEAQKDTSDLRASIHSRAERHDSKLGRAQR